MDDFITLLPAAWTGSKAKENTEFADTIDPSLSVVSILDVVELKLLLAIETVEDSSCMVSKTSLFPSASNGLIKLSRFHLRPRKKRQSI